MSLPSPDIVLAEFCAEVAENGAVWTVRRGTHIAQFLSDDGEGCVPFWSTRERASQFLAATGEVSNFMALEVPWEIFMRAWVGEIIPANAEIGINWTSSQPACWATIEEVLGGVTEAT